MGNKENIISHLPYKRRRGGRGRGGWLVTSFCSFRLLRSLLLYGDINIKFDPALKLVVCKRERNEMINDFRRIYQIILKMLSFHDSGLPVPNDMQSLLDLLNCDDSFKHQEIIRYNISLLSEIGEKSHFITLYDRLQ